MFYRIFALSLLTAGLSAYARVNPCSTHLLGATPLSPAALIALQEARGAYALEAVQKVVDGEPRVVILAGETHVKGNQASVAGKRLLEHFNLRGLEGADTRKNGIAGAIMSPFLNAMNWFPQKFLGLKGSTIDEAEAHAEAEFAKNVYAFELASKIKEQEKREIIQLTADEESALAEKLESFSISVDGFEPGRDYAAEELLPLVREYLGRPPLDAYKRATPVNVNLEKGHQPGLRENLSLLEIPFSIGFGGLQLGLGWAASPATPELAIAASVSSFAGILYTAQSITGHLLTLKHSDKRWFRAIFPLHGGLIDGRNETMVRNIDAGFQANPQFNQMLVIVGKAHVPGMKRLLVEGQGYSPVPIPAPVNSSKEKK